MLPILVTKLIFTTTGFIFVLVIAYGVIGGSLFSIFGWRKRKSTDYSQVINPPIKFDAKALGSYFLQLARYPEVFLCEEARYQHMQIVGASGTGKTRDGILPYIAQDISHDAGVGVLDVKSNLSPKIAGFAERFERDDDFFRFELKDPEHSLTYNPLVGDDSAEVANRLHTALFQNDHTSTPFYRDTALDFLRNFFALCHELKVLPTFIQLREIASDQQQLELFANLAPHTHHSKILKQRYVALTKTKFTNDLQGLVNKIAPFTDGPFAKLLNTHEPEILMKDILSKGKIVVFGLAADLYPSDFKVLSTMILMDIHTSLTHRYHSRSHKGFFLYMDEVADLVYPGFRPLIAKAREAKVGLILAHQAQGDLKAVSDAFLDSIMSNTSNKVIFRLGTSDTAEQFSRLIGTETIREKNVSYQSESFSESVEKGFTYRDHEKFLVHPNVLKTLAVGEAVMVLQFEHGRLVYKGKTWHQHDRDVLYDLQANDAVLCRRPAKNHFEPLTLEVPVTKSFAVTEKANKTLNQEIMNLVSGKTRPTKAPSYSRKNKNGPRGKTATKTQERGRRVDQKKVMELKSIDANVSVKKQEGVSTD